MASSDSDTTGGPRRPRIGLSTYLERAQWGVGWDRPAALLPAAYLEAFAATGAVPLLLAPSPHGAREAVAAIEALVLSGGGDIDPRCYGQQPHERTAGVVPERDAWELALLRAALGRELPVLGLCRGAQVLNVAMGGTLHQHLPDVVGHERHRPGGQVFAATPVRLAPGSRVGAALGERIEGPCYHHQGIDRLGEGLAPVGWADDGSVEALELDGHRFVVGVQWHPEENPGDSRLLDALIAAARQPTEGG